MPLFRVVVVILVLVTALSAAGCRTAGVGDLTRPEPLLAPTANTATAREILAEHNRNAERVQVLEAKPELTITIADKPNKPPSTYSVDGTLTMERPRNFKLDISSHTSRVADIGSNDAEYWFWVNDPNQRVLYFCRYDEAGANPPAPTFQPDWIIEAMGLRVIPESEANQITVKPGDAGKLVLTHRPQKAGDLSFSRVTIIDKATHRILEHQIRSGDQKTLLSRAVVLGGYIDVHVLSDSSAESEPVYIPRQLKLQWVAEKLDMEVSFRYAKINNPIKATRREYLFVEPKLGRGFTRVNLADGPPTTASPTTIRESRPAPPSGGRIGGIKLREPAPLEADTEEAASRPRSDRPVALNGEEPSHPSLTEEVIGARFPIAAEPEPVRAESPSAGWRAARGPVVQP